MLILQLAANSVQIGVGALQIGPRFQPSNRDKGSYASHPGRRIELDRSEYVRGAKKIKKRGQDADDCVKGPIDGERYADNRGISAVLPLPQAVAEDRGSRPFPGFLF